MNGGGLFDIFRSKKLPLDKAIDSESEFIDTYKNYLIVKNKYDKVYNEHKENLITLDNLYNLNNGLSTLFFEYIFPNDIKNKTNYDLENPLLLKTYSITSDSYPSEVRAEHLKRQVWYQVNKLHPNDSSLVTDIDITINKNLNAVVSFYLDQNSKYNAEITVSKNYVLDINELKENIISIIKKYKSSNYLLQKRKPEKLRDDILVHNIKNNSNEKYSSDFINNKNKLEKKLLKKKGINNSKSEVSEIEYNTNESKEINNDYLSEKTKKQLDPFYKINYAISGEPKELPTGENKPLTESQILHFQHQQVLNTETNNDGQTQFVDKNVIFESLKDILGLVDPNEKEKSNSNKYENMSLDELKKIDTSKLTKEELDVVCPRFSEDEETCLKIKECWFNAKSDPKCYRFKQKDET